MKLHTDIIGSAWGKLPWPPTGVQHHWRRTEPKAWTSDCGDHRAEAVDEFRGLPSFNLLFDRDGQFCKVCLDIYRETWLSAIVRKQSGDPDGIIAPSHV